MTTMTTTTRRVLSSGATTPWVRAAPEEARRVLAPPPLTFAPGSLARMDSLDMWLLARGYGHNECSNPTEARVMLSHLLSYPMTLGNAVREMGLLPLRAGAGDDRDGSSSASTLTVAVLGARAEASLPLVW